MCVAPSRADACGNYEADTVWMKNSGNLCWGMGAGNHVPCKNCGVDSWLHGPTEAEEFLDAEVWNG